MRAKRVQEDKLRLSVTFASDHGVADAKATPHFVSDVRRFLSMSGLKNSQWIIKAEPPNGSESGTARNSISAPAPAEESDLRTIAANHFHCDFKSFQDF